MSYLPCELHCHSNHGEGNFSVSELLQKSADDHLALIAITDKNTTDGFAELDDSVTPSIKGMECATPYGSLLALGIDSAVDTSNTTPDNIDSVIQELRGNGAVVGISHPFDENGAWKFNLRNHRNIDFIEVWHSAFTFANAENDRALAMWTELLDKGCHIACTYGKDWKNDENSGHFGCTYLDIDGEINQHNALKALRMGKSVASTGVKFFFRVHQKGVTYTIGETLKKGSSVFSFFTDLHSREKNSGAEEVEYQTIKLITNGGVCVMETAVSERHIHINLKNNHWYRAELWGKVDGEKKLLAVTSPIYTV